MAKKETQPCCEKFKTMIGGQALIEGIMMRGPEKDAIVIRGKDGLTIETTQRKIRPKGSFATWPLIRGCVNFFDSQVAGVKALTRSADLSPDEDDLGENPSKFDLWLEKKLGNEKFQKALVGISVALGLGMSIFLFFLIHAGWQPVLQLDPKYLGHQPDRRRCSHDHFYGLYVSDVPDGGNETCFLLSWRGA